MVVFVYSIQHLLLHSSFTFTFTFTTNFISRVIPSSKAFTSGQMLPIAYNIFIRSLPKTEFVERHLSPLYDVLLYRRVISILLMVRLHLA